jgi:uncharacterized protein YkwD
LNIFFKPNVSSRNRTEGKGFSITFHPSHPMLNRKRRKFRDIKLPSRIVSVIFLVFFFGPFIGFSQSRTVGDAKFLLPLENAVVHEINMARTAPKDYASLLEQRRKYYDKKILRLPGETPILTKEGVRAVVEAIRFLRSMKSIHSLTPSKGMSSGAKDHVKDQGSSSASQHKGSDGSQPSDRVNRYGTWEKSIGENISYGSHQARDIVLSLIIDDGVPSRGHRKNIFNPDFSVIGVACGPHPAYRMVCVITFAGGYKEKNGK